jgi:hypothetical protein
MKRGKLSAEAIRRREEILRIGQRGVERAQAENRRRGIPNVYCVNGVVMYELLDGTLSQSDPMTEYHDIDEFEGIVICANHKRRVLIGDRYAVILHNQWASDVERKVHKVALDLLSDSSKLPNSNEERQTIINRIFSSFDD